jgi:actin-like ATPase involved in cell morphogenesis
VDSLADELGSAIGMSVGAHTLAAVTADRAVTRKPVLTLYRNRSSQVGVPADNPADPEIDGTGLVFTDFVGRVGDPTPVVAADGSAHRGEQLLADGLHALACLATQGSPLPPAVAVTHPAFWPPVAVDALRAALNRVPEWSQQPVFLVSDVAAAVIALRTDPGLPESGIVAVCDFGGSGTSITFVDAARGYQPIGATVRDADFSGELIDQALLNYLVTDLSANGSLHGKFPIGSLAELRGQCHDAKEQLSATTVTELMVDLPGFHGGVWVTRAELDEAIRQPLDGFLDTLQETLDRSKIRAPDLTAVTAVGGGAGIPAITTALAQRLGVAVTSSARPHLTVATGAALRAARGVADSAEAATTPPAAEDEALPDATWRGRIARRPVPLILGVVAAVLVAGVLAVIALRNASSSEPATPNPGEPTAPTTTVSVSESPARQTPAPQTEETDVQTSDAPEPAFPEQRGQMESAPPEPTTGTWDEPATTSWEPTPSPMSEQPPFPHIGPGRNEPPGPRPIP